ncbi:hypothetical protein HPB48_013789 [Haemaphysalis longicornis]|uniref:Uncharacterized protein n=1 Tax=Haemaphysalis longicornis TaxID=44386 RepID=A0A9J6GWM9_HAELO|nr:hypothetical protein HPB48_013789 [Haemaphysalis longicornis]
MIRKAIEMDYINEQLADVDRIKMSNNGESSPARLCCHAVYLLYRATANVAPKTTSVEYCVCTDDRSIHWGSRVFCHPGPQLGEDGHYGSRHRRRRRRGSARRRRRRPGQQGPRRVDSSCPPAPPQEPSGQARDLSAAGPFAHRDLSRDPTWATVAVGGAAASSRRRSKSARRERSASRGRRASRSGSRHNSTRRPAAKPNGSENAELRERVNEMRATIHEQRITIERLSKQLEELRGLPKKGLRGRNSSDNRRHGNPPPGSDRKRSSRLRRQARPPRPLPRHGCSESEEEIDADGDDAESVVSSSSAKATGAAKTPGYAGLSNRCRRLENQMNRWGKDLENMEKRLTNRIDRALNQMMQQVNQAVGQMTQLQQQLQQQFSPENMKTLEMNAIQEHFDNGASQQHSP